MATDAPGQEQLRARVLECGLCTLCGACSGLCPYLKPFQGRVAVLDVCPLVEARCFAFCPRTGVDMDQASQQAVGLPYGGKPLGEVRQILMARSSNPDTRKGAQYGGTVSTLVCTALEEGMIGAALLTRSEGGFPRGVIATTREEVLACRGSNYVAAPTLEALNQWQPAQGERIGVVGTPCQALALAKMRGSPLVSRSNSDRVALTVGLFCTWALSHRFLELLKGQAQPAEVHKMDVPPPPASVFEVYTARGSITLPLEQVRPLIQPGCAVCADMTAELTDLSVGSAEGIEGWNTLLVRTPQGEALVERAVAGGALETQPLPQGNLDHLTEAAALKKRRAFERLTEHTGHRDDLGYLQVSPATVRRVFGDDGPTSGDNE